MRAGSFRAAVLAAPILLAAPAHAGPEGSYAETCTNIHFAGSRLVADCPDRAGRLHRSMIDWQGCGGDVVNDDGQLDCRRGRTRIGAPAPPPVVHRSERQAGWGAGAGTITLFQHPGFTGSSVTVGGPIDDVARVGLAGAADSVDMSGQWTSWEVCEGTHFRGRCVIVRGGAPDLQRLGLAGPAASARPID